MQTKKHLNDYDRGQVDYAEGITVAEAPYLRGSPEFREWYRGFFDAKQTKAQKEINPEERVAEEIDLSKEIDESIVPDVFLLVKTDGKLVLVDQDKKPIGKQSYVVIEGASEESPVYTATVQFEGIQLRIENNES